MKNNLFIPKELKVGFKERSDTFTGKLAYIIYIDESGVLRKEGSWNGWRDKKIPVLDVSNVPTEGFVLNKKAGGYSSGWNHRRTVCRVYDPRDFEIEIDITNLLYILENTNCIKGKGLEGTFVYAWEGNNLILIPTNSPDYDELMKFQSSLYEENTIKSKDLIPGAKYLTRTNEVLTYLDRNNYYDHYYEKPNRGKAFFFEKESGTYEIIKSTASLERKLIKCLDENAVADYAELMDELQNTVAYVGMGESVWNSLTEQEWKRFLRGSFTYKDRNVALTIDNVKANITVAMKLEKDRICMNLSWVSNMTPEHLTPQYYSRFSFTNNRWNEVMNSLKHLSKPHSMECMRAELEKFDIKIEQKYLKNGRKYGK
jgi:hypothetical protein